MKTHQTISIIGFIGILSLVLSACGGQPQPDKEQQLATIVASTMTAISAVQGNNGTPATGLHPLANNCEELKNALEPTLGIPVSVQIVPVQMSWDGETGNACQMTGSGDGNKFNSLSDISANLNGMLASRGWQDNSALLPCLGYGGAGPGARQVCYLHGNQTCEVMVTYGPVDNRLCPTDKPINECLAGLAPEQQLYTINLTCAEGSTP